ncbi:putative PurR-regulated permease PerM [Lachnotalea glycerini]|uniref:AI-2E family transporter n=1 Tax=Lachnotalea glycerini TaxID=1763509 RepID=A0A255IN29_9FIRM|nr:AI-2E family transporter [Lachnotalea glycerini]PXV95637.1 putative PurR-regulated permease PerM [Lachnotalea glycerini]RDY32925.1 AI-2E family transporter [Lachnotalea glycerini]
MRYHWDKKYLYWGVTAFFVIAVSILFFYGVFHNNKLVNFFDKLITILMPIIYGMIIAYLLAPVVNYLEKHIFFPFFFNKCNMKQKKKSRKRIRGLAIFITLSIAILSVVGLFSLLLPQLFISMSSLIATFPTNYENFSKLLGEILVKNPDLESTVTSNLDAVSGYIEQYLNQQILPKMNDIFVQFSSGILNFIGVLNNLLIGVIVSIYVLSSKELFAAQSKKLVYAALKPYRANILIKNLRLTNDMFSGFISGKLLDSFLIGILCFIGTKLLNTPYPVLVSVIIGVTNVIPFFGPYLGAIPCGILILFVDPLQFFYFIVFIIILQTFDGNILGPKILGHSTGLSSFWIIVAILLGGGLFGILGMFIGVPVFAVIYALVKAFVNRSLIAHNLPHKTTDYYNLDYIDEDTFHKFYNRNEKEESKLHSKLEEIKAKIEVKEDQNRSNNTKK